MTIKASVLVLMMTDVEKLLDNDSDKCHQLNNHIFLSCGKVDRCSEANVYFGKIQNLEAFQYKYNISDSTLETLECLINVMYNV